MGRSSPVELIEPTLSAVTAGSEASYEITQDRIPTTIVADALINAEEVDIFFSIDGGTTWRTLMVDGIAVVLTATDNAKTFYGPMMIGVLKDATGGQLCGVYAINADKV